MIGDKKPALPAALLLTGLSAITVSVPVWAQGANEGTGLEEIVVTGYRFLNEDTSGTTNLPLPIEKVPQSISLISNDFLKAADIKTLGEVAQYTPGAIFSGNGENYRTDIKFRGFTNGEAVDGLPLGSGAPLAEYDYAVVERLEIVKGPSSVVYGASSPGGIVNVVTKKATPETPEYFSVDIGMWNNYRIEGQVGGAIGADGRLSAIGVGAYEQGDSFTDIIKHDRTVLYGGLDFAITDSLSAYARGGYEKNTRTSFDGIPQFEDGTQPPVARSFFIGSDQSRYELQGERMYVTAGLDWDVTDLWSVSVKGNFSRNEQEGAAIFSGGLQADGSIDLFNEENLGSTEDVFAAGISSVYKLDGLGLSDSFISVGAVYNESSYYGKHRFYYIGSGNIFDGVRSITNIINAAPITDPGYFLKIDDSLLTYSAQAVLRVLDPLTVLVGASYSGTDFDRDSDALSPASYEYDGEVSYRGGLTYEFAPGFNGYLSYSESFMPQRQSDINDNPLKPLIGEQKELGLKYAPPGGRVLFTAALFEILQSNKPEFDQTTPAGDRFKAVGEVRHRGAELEVIGRVADRWQVHAGYAYLNPEVTKNQESPEMIGKTITYLPKHTASVFASYELLDGFTVGAGARYVDSVNTTYDDSVKDLPAYAIVDATASYAFQNWRFQLNVHNLFDEKYYINTYETVYYGNVIGEPANVSLSARYEF
ncbi:TonB-dependent siderophore receptor [Steroidobacter sp.]|uniref:TonB-dependent siderophore receptor n=1 Tax=Steroidobacter sp. TaxID=1978227 RepID=UPI001A40EBB3|nr:TonB-dependent siderophore receptor [Steroidobacter sp.]MBL8270307.1 TonB-dependent siderophore receptor [Steroidobacter sp.]